MILSLPLKNVQLNPPIAPTPDAVYVSQYFGNVWLAQKDMVLNGIPINKGENVYKKLFGWEGHNGIDIAAPKGTPIYASRDGYIVEATEKTGGYGIRVCLFYEDELKNQYLEVYGHLDSFVPLPEIPYDYFYRLQKVKRGEQIGTVDSTGISTGHHLHWGLHRYKDGVKLNNNNGYGGAIDPMPFVKDKFMEFFQIEGEQTLVLKNLDGKFLVLASTPEFYPIIAQKFGLEGKNFPTVSKSEVESNKAGDIVPTFGLV